MCCGDQATLPSAAASRTEKEFPARQVQKIAWCVAVARRSHPGPLLKMSRSLRYHIELVQKIGWCVAVTRRYRPVPLLKVS